MDTHPCIASPAELNLGSLCEGLYEAAYHTIGFNSSVAFEEHRSLIALEEVRRIVSDLMTAYATAKGKQLWCEKSPMNLNHLDILSAVFPDARYICLYRNCMDVVYSILEFNRLKAFDELLYYINRNSGNFVSAIVDYWVDLTSKEVAFEHHGNAKCFRLKYESLVLDPAGTLKPLFAFLGVEFTEGLIDSVFSSQHDPGKGDPKAGFSARITTSSLGKGSSLSRANISPDLEEKMNALLGELGYPLVGPDWDYLPSPYSVPDHRAKKDDHSSTVEDVFAKILPEHIKKHANRLTTATCKIVISGDGGGVWLIKPGGQIVAGDGKAECVIMTSTQDLLELVSGRLNAAAAFDQGRLRVAGDTTAANVLGSVLFGG